MVAICTTCGGGGGADFVAAGQNGGEAAGGDRDAQDDETRGFHTLHFPQRLDGTDTAVLARFHQPNVNSWLMRRI